MASPYKVCVVSNRTSYKYIDGENCNSNTTNCPDRRIIAGWQAITLLTTNYQFLQLSIITCTYDWYPDMIRWWDYLHPQIPSWLPRCSTGVTREEMTYRLRTDSYDLKPPNFSDRHWLGFSFHFDHLATSLQIDKINGDCQDNHWSKYIEYLWSRENIILLLFINWLLELE